MTKDASPSGVAAIDAGDAGVSTAPEIRALTRAPAAAVSSATDLV
ncbi:hypothetical protein [Nocardia sp. NPDC058633]